MTNSSQGFRRDARGNVAIIAALTLMMLVSIVLGTLEYARAYSVRYSLQAALDAAALAAAKETIDSSASVATTESRLAAVAQSVLVANLNINPAAATVTPVRVKYTPPVGFTVPDKIELTASATVNNSFLKSLGFKPMTVAVSSATQPPQNPPVELVLVLDVTASMNLSPSTGGEKKIDTLKTAAKLLVDKVMGSGSPNIKIGIVPYNTYVNYGTQDGVPNWLLPIDRSSYSCSVWGPYSNPNGTCTRSYYDCVVDGFMTTNGCYSQTCDYGTRSCLQYATYNFPWSGCIGARSVLSFNFANPGLSTTTEAFLDNISSPTSPKYTGQATNVGIVGNTCPGTKMQDLTTDKALLNNAITALKGSGDTHVPSGLIWGWNMLVPGEPFRNTSTRQELAKIGGKKVIVLMTDGINSMAPRLYDGLYAGFANSSLNPPKWRLRSTTDDLTARICENIKRDGNDIKIYTVMFDVQDAAMQKILRDCTNDAATMAFTASDRAGLLKAFTDIGDQLRQLKLTN